MKSIIPAIVISAISLSLSAESTGRIQGKVLSKSGKPIAGATVTLKRLDIAWSKEVKTSAEGSFLQVGLNPTMFEVTVKAEGYVPHVASVKIPLGDAYKHEVTLLTPEERIAEDRASGKQVADPSAAAADAATTAFNSAVSFYNQQNFAAALPLAEQAAKGFKETAEKSTDATAKTEQESRRANAEKVLGGCLFEVGKTDPTKRKELWEQAEPLILTVYQKNPKDQATVYRLLEIATFKQDAVAMKKYQKELDDILGPRPELAFNQGADAYNKGDMKSAKGFFEQAIQVDPKFAEAYYLLAMCEFGEMNLKATKANLQKYLELAPNGKNAQMAKDMLNDPSLKKIK